MSLKATYLETVLPQLQTQLGVTNRHAAPKLEKVVVNVGTGSLREVAKIHEIVPHDLALITGQKPVARQARKAVAAFKLRAGEIVGYAVTLRGARMYDFFQRLISITLPRIRDFRGLPLDGFDGHGNYSFGIREHAVFPEIDHDHVQHFYGLGVTVHTSAKSNQAGEALLRSLGFPLQKREGN
ncbi:50S ribosomal protein L5 [Candidatus Berkelbacteria bacterium]|nr:50S ribosomal protein L5 [Candidatus Berkelbacteria bacterium]